jgi:EF hand
MRTFLIACAGALALGGAAAAQDLNTRHLAALDSNGDGAVDQTEFDAFVASSFTTMDANGDGFVTLAEGQAAGTTPEHFTAANTNGDDGLSQEEFAAAAAADFAAADRDGDGMLN